MFGWDVTLHETPVSRDEAGRKLKFSSGQGCSRYESCPGDDHCSIEIGARGVSLGIRPCTLSARRGGGVMSRALAGESASIVPRAFSEKTKDSLASFTFFTGSRPRFVPREISMVEGVSEDDKRGSRIYLCRSGVEHGGHSEKYKYLFCSNTAGTTNRQIAQSQAGRVGSSQREISWGGSLVTAVSSSKILGLARRPRQVPPLRNRTLHDDRGLWCQYPTALSRGK